MSAFEVRVARPLAIAADSAFAGLVALDAARAFTGYGPLPAVTAVEGASIWQSVDQQRTLTLADGSTLVETLVAIDPPHGYAYRADQYSSAFRHLVKGASAQWRFVSDAQDPGGCTMYWTYRYIPRHWLAAPLVWVITHTLWRGYMRRSIARCAALISE